MNVEKRQKIERKIIRHLIRTMKANNWNLLWVHNGEEKIQLSTETEALDHVFSVDESTIAFQKIANDSKITRSAYIVLGNDGWDCIADHSLSSTALQDDDFEIIMDTIIYPYCETQEMASN